MKGLKYGDVDPDRLWYTLETSLEFAREFAHQTGVRQRVKRIDKMTNVYRCTWLIEEI